MTLHQEQFDDPELKAAIRGLRGGHKASPDLRARVIRRLAEARSSGGVHVAPAPPVEPAPLVLRPRFQLRRWLAVAASVAIVAGGVGGYRYYRHAQEEHEEYARNTALMGAMIGIHDLGRGTASGLQPFTTALAEPAALAAEARTRLGRSVPVVDLKARGWTLDAADVCTIGASPAVRFHLTRGTQNISVLSIPSSIYADADEGDHYELLVTGHPIAGYVKDGSLNCVVGDPSLTREETVSLRDTIRGG